MPSTPPETRELMRLAAQNARACGGSGGGYREWSEHATWGLEFHFEITKAEANRTFDEHLIDQSKPVFTQSKAQPGYEDICHDFCADTPDGEIMFEFILNDRDPTDPLIKIVSVHPPSFKRQK